MGNSGQTVKRAAVGRCEFGWALASPCSVLPCPGLVCPSEGEEPLANSGSGPLYLYIFLSLSFLSLFSVSNYLVPIFLSISLN